ncbi:WcbI family polysaccharide biosynthesis putative acetyltransferase [Glaciecola sp. 1036]|uniref:WcbI family polysaccharide biosynthesis putative acetyltransferase n=1 Tax=Alteromonadaceae TaxID=72275 RepID=UPI003CFF48C8
MKRFIVIGNCQRGSIINVLKSSDEFKSSFEEVGIPPVFLMKAPHFKKLESELREVDLVVYQPILSSDFQTASSGYVESVVSESNRIKVPNAFFQGYHPDLVEFKLSQVDTAFTPLMEKTGSHHSATLIQLFNAGKDVKQAITVLSELNQTIRNKIKKVAAESIQELKSREVNYNLDVCISSFIEQNFKQKKLFHIHNHPSNIVVKLIVQEIQKRFSLDENSISMPANELHGFSQPPILPVVKEALELEFECQNALFNESKYSFNEWIENCYELYSRCSNFNDHYANSFKHKSLI